MPEPTIGTSLGGLLEILTAGVLSGLAGWFGKHFKDRNRPGGDLPRHVSRQIAEIHSALYVPDPELRLNLIQQTALLARYMSEPDQDGTRVSWVRRVLTSVADSIGKQTEILSRMEERVGRLEESGAGGAPNSSRRPRRQREEEGS